MASRYTPLLRHVEIFENVSEADLDRIGELAKEHRYRENQTIFRQGDPGDALYIVLEGRIKVFVQDGGVEKVLAFYGAGEVLGEMSLLTGETRSATAVAVGDTQVLAVTKADFDAYLGSNVAVMREMMRVIALRQAQTNVRLTRTGEFEPAAPARQGKVYTVFSPRGGSGKTMVAVNVAVALAQLRPEQVSLIDASLTFGHCALVLNLTPRVSLASVRAEEVPQMDREAARHYLETHPSTLKVLTGALKPEEGEAVTGDHIRNAIELLRRIYDVVIVDTAPVFSEATIAALELADRILLLCTPELSTLRDVRECQRIFTDLIHIPREKVYYVMNNPLPFKPVAVDQFAQALEQDIHFEIPFGNDVPAKAATHGEAFTQTQSGSTVAKAVDRIARALEADALPGVARQPERRGLFGRR